MGRIKILHIAQCAGGVDCYLRMLFSNMDRERFTNVLVCSQDYNRADYERIVDCVEQIEMINSLSPSKDGAAVKAVRALIRKHRPDIVYCHSSKAGGIGRLASIGLGCPVVYNPHGWAFCMEGSRIKRLVYLWIERILAKWTRQFVCISNYEKLIAVNNHVTNMEKVKTIFNGIDFENVEKQIATTSMNRLSLGIPEDAYLVGMVGRISRQKAPDVFVEMTQRIKAEIPQAWFMIVGDGDERQVIEELIREKGLQDCFSITGWIENPLAYAHLFDQAVLLSRWEGFGLVLAEYMKLGKPIVATETNAIPDLITDHDNGLLVPVDDAERAAEAVLEIYHNPSLQASMIEKGLMRVNAFFDVRRTAKEHEQLFINICSKKGK